MRRYKNKIIILSLLLLFFLVGCTTENKIEAEAYSKEQLLSHLEQGIYDGKETLDFNYLENQTTIEPSIKTVLEEMMTTYLGRNLLKTIHVSYEQEAQDTKVHIQYEYLDGIHLPIIVANDYEDMITHLIKGWERHFGKVSFIVKNQDYDEQTLFAILNTAETNASNLPYEASDVFYEAVDKDDSLQIIHMWANFPSDVEDMNEKQTELKARIQAYGTAIQKQQLKEEKAIYDAIYETVIATTAYDNILFFSTKGGVLGKNDHLNKSSYGALVSGHTVCTGYARAFKALSDYLEYPSWVVLGTKDGVPHAWNLVYINHEAFYIDCTHGDTGESKENTFLLTIDQLNALGYTIDSGILLP